MKHSKSCIFSAFGVELISGGGIWLPKLLLQNYSKLGISNQEMMLLLHLLCALSSDPGPYSIGDIAANMGVPASEIVGLMRSLSGKGVLSWDASAEYILSDKIVLLPDAFAGLFDKVLEVWGCEQAQKHQQQQGNSQEAKTIGASKAVSNLYRCFEKEFGRPLSPIESTQIMEWYYGDRHSFELILEALKRAVLRGVVNFKYIDSILKGWSKNNLKTVKAVIAHEDSFAENKKGKRKAATEFEAADLDKKYTDIYLS